MLRLGQMDTKGLVRALGEEALLRYVSDAAGRRRRRASRSLPAGRIGVLTMSCRDRRVLLL